MIKVLFVCHGNICRSPMAEFVMRDMVKNAGLDGSIIIESAATSYEEIGNPVYPPARRKLAEHGLSCAGKTARHTERCDYDGFDLLIGMDSENLRNMRRIYGGDLSGKIFNLLDFAGRTGQSVADPWYTGDFEATWKDVNAGCRGLLDYIMKRGILDMKTYPRILTIQDISCVGQCSLTVALPILSACGVETCILPSAVLSTHTAGFFGYTFRDLADDIPAISAHWKKESIVFDGVYTGYLGSIGQIDYVKDIMDSLLAEDGLKIVDPAMADNGKLYPAFDMEYVEAMKTLCAVSDYCVPNITEACMLTGIEYRESYDRAYVETLLKAICGLGAKTAVLTGVSYKEGRTGVAIYEDGEYSYYEHEKLSNSCHGTGDVYASAFAGALMRGHDAFDSARIAADYTVACIKNTAGDSAHWYGVKFEPVLGELAEMM